MGADRPDAAFAAELARLKRRGSAVLVRDAGDGIGVCADLLGSDAEERRRVLARSAGDAVLPVPPTGATVVDVTPRETRSSAARPADAFAPRAVVHRVAAADGIDALVDAVAEAVERGADDVAEPGRLRVCLGRLDGFVERESAETVAGAVGSLWDAVRDRAGMGHAHLAADPPEAVARTFDVTVETRTNPAGLRESRWRVHAAGIDTGWMRMHER